MTRTVDPKAVKDYILKHLRVSGSSGVPTEISDNVNLIESGVLDSMGFVSMIVAIEDNFGISIDLADSDPQDFLTVRGLVTIVAPDV